MKKKVIVLLSLFLLLAQNSPAPIFGLYPRLDELVKRADVVAIIKIHKLTVKEQPFRGSYRYDSSFKIMLKGDAPKDSRATVGIRYLPHPDQPYRKGKLGITVGHTYLVFLRNAEDADVSYAALNNQGNHWEIPDTVKLPSDRKLSPREAVQYVLEESLKVKKKEVKVLEEVLKEQKNNPPIGHLKTKDKLITIKNGKDGPLYTVKSKDGKVLAVDIPATELSSKFPELKDVVQRGIADWAGLDAPDITVAP